MEALARHGDDVFVVWDAEDPGAGFRKFPTA